jgi:hypothetical protein
MTAKTPPPGRPFGDDYREESYGDAAARLQQVLRTQLAELAGDGETRQDTLVGILMGRRSGRPDLPQPEPRRRDDGGDCYVARGEIVLPASVYRADGIRDVLAKYEFRESDAGRWPGRGDLVRLRRPAASRPVVERVLGECGRPGTAWPNYLAAMAAVGKGIGGPEPVGGMGTFAAHREAWVAEHGDAPAPAVAVIDTGLPARRRKNDGWLDLQRTLDDVDRLDVLPAGPDGTLDFQAGHGTFVAGIVQRVAPTAPLRMYRAADTDGFATDDDIADAVRAAYADGAAIISLSLGGKTEHDQPPPAMRAAVEEILADPDHEVVVIAAAGNFGDADHCWPAALPGVVAVAGLTAAGEPATWSSHGPHVRFSVVAEGLRSTFVTGRESPVFDPEPEEFGVDAWAMWSGTSFAAPQIAGAVARVCLTEGVGPQRAVELLAGQGPELDGYGTALVVLDGLPTEAAL